MRGVGTAALRHTRAAHCNAIAQEQRLTAILVPRTRFLPPPQVDANGDGVVSYMEIKDLVMKRVQEHAV
jgi:hypothetical protein